MSKLSKQDEDELLEKISDLPDSEKAQIFGDLNGNMQGQIGKLSALDRVDNLSITLFAIFGSITLICGIVWAITLANKGGISSIAGIIALISLFLTIVSCATALIIENKADGINVRSENRDSVQSTFDKMKLLDRYDNAMASDDGDKLDDEAKLYQKLNAYLTFAYYCGLGDRVNALIEDHNKIAVLSEGLDKMEDLDSTGSDQYGKLYDLFLQQLASFGDGLKKLIEPYINQIIMKLIKLDRVDILPNSVKHNLAGTFADKLLRSANDDDDDDF